LVKVVHINSLESVMKPKFPAMQHPLYGVIWDMDGVLIDSGPYHLSAWKQTLANYNIALAPEQFQQMFGVDNRDFLTKILGHVPDEAFLEKISLEKESLYRNILKNSAVLMPGVERWLKGFQESGIKQIVASSAPPENVDTFVSDFHLGQYFQHNLSALREGLPGKPAPDIFLRAAEYLQLPVENCVVIEDAIPGVQAAKKGGFYCAAITSTHSREDLALADFILDSFEEYLFA
jgi:beta-phosphoglucomutase